MDESLRLEIEHDNAPTPARIAEVRAYHHGGKKNPQGDLLGFDHEGRGYTMLADWKAPAKAVEDGIADEDAA